MDVNDDHVQTLLAMGFPNESEIRRALQIGKNDLNEAVSILTNEPPVTGYDHLDDVEMKDVQNTSRSTSYPPPPSYDEVANKEEPANEESDEKKGEEDTGLEFPSANLFELENRVFTHSWSIPYKRQESLAKCLVAATKLAKEGLAEKDEQCFRFMDRCLPECFEKLLISNAVHRWGPDIQDGIYDMLVLFVDLVATRLHHQPVPVDLLNPTLALAFNPETEYHTKNKARKPDKAFWEEKFGVGNLYACPSSACPKDYGYLTNLINKFAAMGGFDCISENLARDDMDATSLAALLAPLGQCAEFLHPKVVQPILSPGMEAAVKYVKGLTEDDRKDKRVGAVSELLASMKLLCLALWPQQVQAMDELRLDVALAMLKSPHFNAKMNALKEVTKLIEDSTSNKIVRTAIPNGKIIDWLVDCRVLSIALEGNIDQGQYCDKIKNIVDFLGSQLSPDELTKIWKMQTGQNNVVVDNIHSIIAAAGVKFNAELLKHFFSLIHSTWNSERNATKEKLLNLIGRIGRDSIQPHTTEKVLELLWGLAHLPQLSTGLIDLALEEHLSILCDSHNVKEHLKRAYLVKCVDDIKEGKWVLPALKQLLRVAENISKSTFNKAEKGILQELNKSYDIMKQVISSLVKLHQQAVENCTILTPETLVDRRYMHKDYVNVHLQFLQFILHEGVLYLPPKSAKYLWGTLVSNPDACEWDRDTCFDWLRNGIADLETECQSQVLHEFLKLQPEKLSNAGFQCFKQFFETVNVTEHRMKKMGTTITVEKRDLLGLDFLWEVCLNTPSEEISEAAIALLIAMSYTNLKHTIRKDSVSLHGKFIDACYKRLEMARLPLGGSLVAQCLMDSTRIVSAIAVPDVNSFPSPSKQSNLLSIERLLWLAECYVTTVEDQHNYPRTILAHGAAFQGQPLSLFVTCEAPKVDFNIAVHSNETVGSLRHKIAARLSSSPDNVQIVVNDKVLNKEQKLLHQLGIEDNQVVSARTYTAPSVSSSMALVPLSASSASASPSSSLAAPSSSPGDGSGAMLSSLGAGGGGAVKASWELEQERQLPGVVMAAGGQVFDMLYTLADLDEPKITSRARNLLKLIPTDPSVQDTLETLGHKSPRQATPEPPSPKLSPRNSPRKGGASSAPPPNAGGGLTPSSSTSSLHKSSREVLRTLFDPSAPDMSTFRVLYNLEVLSSQLMPTARDAVTLQTAAAFCTSFLAADGLALVVRTLQCPATDDYPSRQGCYAIALQLLRFLLCEQEVTGESFLARRITGGGEAPAPDAPLSVDVSSPSVACKAIQTMSVPEFTETVGCFVRVAWAAAAGNLQLATTMTLPDTSSSSSASTTTATGRSRQSSTGSNTSSGSGDEQSLQPGVCSRPGNKVSARDATIAKEALELLVTCLRLRHQLLSTFYSISCAGDFILDLLVGCPVEEIRDTALEQFYELSKTPPITTTPGSGSGEGEEPVPPPPPPPQSPHHYMLHTLLRARLPFWVQSSSTRGASQRLLRQCKQYFELRCRLLLNLTVSQQAELGVNVASMLDDEIGWLQNFVPGGEVSRDTDNTLLAGHLRLIHTLLTCDGVDKHDIGKSVIHNMLHGLLFPASKLIMDSTGGLDVSSSPGGTSDLSEHTPAAVSHACTSVESRQAGYRVLEELAGACGDNQREICDELVRMHHTRSAGDPEGATEWDYSPPVASRSSAGFVGLKNGGATCYMNSVLQQLFMAPGVVEAVLGVDDSDAGDNGEDTVLFQLQTVLGHLLESKLQYYKPENFWKIFRLWGQEINIREQQDAFDFYTALLDQVEERLKKIGKESIFKKRFQGIYSDQKICKGCPHRYEREEVFFALNVTVKNATLQDSLAQFVKGELLEGDNQYFCEKCGEKRDTIKRMCIKTLPNMLCIQLKRFSWDWETNRAIKFDDYFKFPWTLDMEPYTAEGLARQDQAEAAAAVAGGSSGEEAGGGGGGWSDGDAGGGGGGGAGDGLSVNTTAAIPATKQIQYELAGVVVHSGQANAGHYYSLIKDRRGNHMTNLTKGKWFKFNDCDVEEFDMTDATLETECFGGTYKTKVYEQSSSYPEERLRFWNGYLLFYERVEEIRTPRSAKKSRVSLRSKPPPTATATATEAMPNSSSMSKRSSDSFVELTALVHKGEKRGLFAEKMPARIQQVVRAHNLRYMKNRDVYDADYFRFVRHLVAKNMPSEGESEDDPERAALSVRSVEMGMIFLCHTYLRSKSSLRADLADWVLLLSQLVQRSKAACTWMVDYLSSSQGQAFIKPFLLECPISVVRESFSQILDATIHSFFQHGGVAVHKSFNELIECLLAMLDKDVADNCKTCKEYFSVLAHYVQEGVKACSHLFGKQAFTRLARFLLGAPGADTRRWSSLQAQLFAPLHETLATLVLNCDVSHFRTEPVGEFPVVRPTSVTPQIPLKMSAEMRGVVFSAAYLREVVQATREMPKALPPPVLDMLLYVSFCNSDFSMMVIKFIMLQYTKSPSNELQGLLSVLTALLTLPDPLQLKRLQCVIDGYLDDTDTQYDGMLAVVKSNASSDSRRSYQLIKFLVSLSSKCAPAKDYLLKSPINWQWSVNWLKKKMTEHYWSPTTASTMSNEDSSSKTFQRTISAQTTLEEATDLLKQFEDAQFEESQDSPVSMETGGENMEGIDGENDGNNDADKVHFTIE